MRKKLLTLIIATFTALLPLSATACKTDKNLVRINEVTHSVFYAPLYLADALGYFKDEDITIELTNGGGADATTAAVLSGSADVGFCGPEAPMYVAMGGSTDKIKVFAQLTKRDGSFLVGRKAEPNFDWQDLEGKEILAGRKGGVPAMTFEYTLKERNVTATLNYDVAFNMMASAFDSGVADYCTMFEPVASDFQAAGKGYIVASVGEASGEVPYTCFSAKQSYIDKNPKKIEGIIRAVTKAVQYVYKTDSRAVAESIAKYFDGTPISSVATSVESYKKIDAWVENLAMKESSYDRLLTIIGSAGELEKRVPFADLVITNKAQAVYDELVK